MRKEIGGIGNLVDRAQSWWLTYERCSHVIQFSRRDLPHVEDAERLVREYLATCQECAPPLPPVPIDDPMRQSLRDFWLHQQVQPQQWPTLAGAPWKEG